MEIITFDSGWLSVANDSDTRQWVFSRSDDGRVQVQVGGTDPNPTAFGKFFPQHQDAFATIEAFLKPIEEIAYFQESWAKFCVKNDFAEGAQYLLEERGPRELFTAENVEIFAKLFVACFPFTSSYSEMSYLYDGFYGFSDDNVDYQHYLGARDYRELVVGVTGVWRKDIARVLQLMTLAQMQTVHEFSTLVTSESLVEGMAEAQGFSGQYDFYRGGFQSLSLLQPSVRVRLFKELLKSDRFHSDNHHLAIEDTVNMLAIVGSHKQFRGCQNWQEVHDTAMKLAPKVTGERVVTPPPGVVNLSEVRVSGYSFEILTLPDQFVELGDTLDLCIGKANYYFKALRGDSYCLKVLKDDVPIGALEVVNKEQIHNFGPNGRVAKWTVAQLYGQGNRELRDSVILNRFIVGNLNSSNVEKVLERT